MKFSARHRLALAATAAIVALGCSNFAAAETPSWCGPKQASLALLDGYGGNSWRQVTTASGNSQGLDELAGLKSVLGPEYKFLNPEPFDVTNWDPALTQKVLTAEIAKNSKIDVIVSDFGPSLVGALPLFEKSGRSIPALATSDGNALACFWEEHKGNSPDFKLFTVSTQNDHSRLAIDWAIALATGGTKPSSSTFPSKVFEDSTTGQPNPVTCRKELPGAIYLSAEMPGDQQAALLK